MEGCGVGTYIRGGVFHPVWEIGRFTGGNSVSVQIPGKNPVPIWRQLDGDSPEHQKGAEVLGQAGKYIEMGRGIYPDVGIFYRAVVQEVLLFASESWSMSEAMTSMLELTHV